MVVSLTALPPVVVSATALPFGGVPVGTVPLRVRFWGGQWAVEDIQQVQQAGAGGELAPAAAVDQDGPRPVLPLQQYVGVAEVADGLSRAVPGAGGRRVLLYVFAGLHWFVRVLSAGGAGGARGGHRNGSGSGLSSASVSGVLRTPMATGASKTRGPPRR
ncbi:hypothetical protein GCM10018987_52860 [Streptomyces cremeus]